jgi:hypothetical protein
MGLLDFVVVLRSLDSAAAERFCAGSSSVFSSQAFHLAVADLRFLLLLRIQGYRFCLQVEAVESKT